MADPNLTTIEDAVKINDDVYVIAQFHTNHNGEPYGPSELPKQGYGIQNPANQVLYTESDLTGIIDAYSGMNHGGASWVLEMAHGALEKLHEGAAHPENLEETTVQEFQAIQLEAQNTHASTLDITEPLPGLKA